MENDCDLLNHTATLTTGAPVDENGEDKSLTVTYGLNCIQYSLTDSEHGSVTEADGKRKTGATVGAVIEPVISLDLGYDTDTLSVVRNDNKQNVDVTDNKNFVMPPASVTLNASFKLVTYEISINVELGTLTIYTIFYKVADGLTSLRYRF